MRFKKFVSFVVLSSFILGSASQGYPLAFSKGGKKQFLRAPSGAIKGWHEKEVYTGNSLSGILKIIPSQLSAEYVFFDIDDTVISGEATAELYAKAAQKHGIKVTPAYIRGFIGKVKHRDVQETKEKIFPQFKLDDETVKNIISDYESLFKEMLETDYFQKFLFPEIKEVFGYLTKQGLSIGIVTNREEGKAFEQMKSVGLLGYIAQNPAFKRTNGYAILGGDSASLFEKEGLAITNFKAKKSAQIESLLKIFEIKSSDKCLMVGDTEEDIKSAQVHNMPSFIVVRSKEAQNKLPGDVQEQNLDFALRVRGGRTAYLTSGLEEREPFGAASNISKFGLIFTVLSIWDLFFPKKKQPQKETITFIEPETKKEEITEEEIPKDEINWQTSIEVAKEEALKTNKKLFLYFTQDPKHCTACMMMQRDVLSNPNFKKLLEDNFVSVKINLIYDKQNFSNYYVNATPTILFVDPKTNKEMCSRIRGAKIFWEMQNIIVKIVNGVDIPKIESFMDGLSEQGKKIIITVTENNPSLTTETSEKKVLLDQDAFIKNIIKYLWIYKTDEQKLKKFRDGVLEEIKKADEKRWKRYKNHWGSLNSGIYHLIALFDARQEQKEWSEWKIKFQNKLGIVIQEDNSKFAEDKLIGLDDAFKGLTACQITIAKSQTLPLGAIPGLLLYQNRPVDSNLLFLFNLSFKAPKTVLFPLKKLQFIDQLRKVEQAL